MSSHEGSTARHLTAFARRRAWLQRMRGIMVGLAVLMIGMLAAAIVDHLFWLTAGVRCVISLFVYAAAGYTAWRIGFAPAAQRDAALIARSLESAEPELREQVLAAVELQDPATANGSPEMRDRLERDVNHRLARMDVRQALPFRLVGNHVLTTSLGLATLAALSLIGDLQLPRRLARTLAPFVPIQRASLTRIELIEPAPSSKAVAEGDLVAVVARIDRLGRGDVRLRWYDESGREGEEWMLSRPGQQRTDATDSDASSVPLFSANLETATTPLHYQVLAGDAATLWNTLRPQPRPQAISFEKRFQFPAYAKLGDTVETDDHGDLQALAGSTAQVQIQFDQAVQDATISFVGGEAIAMRPTSGARDRYSVTIPIRTVGAYRVDAVSMRSGLDNPFRPQSAIEPIMDVPPTAHWSDAIAKRRIASPAAVLNLHGKVLDDLPMDQAVFQTVAAGFPVTEHVIEIDPPVLSGDIHFQWDLKQPFGEPVTDSLRNPGAVQLTRKLVPGAILRGRLIAVDRSGKRGESEWIEVVIADQTFDEERHATLEEHQRWMRPWTQWFVNAEQITRQLRDQVNELSQDKRAALDPELKEEVLSWSEELPELRAGTVNQNTADGYSATQDRIAGLSDGVAADRLLAVDRTAGQLNAQMRWAIDACTHLEELFPKNTRENVQRETAQHLRESVSRLEHQSEQAQQLLRAELATEVAAHAMADLQSVEAGLKLLANPQSSIPPTRMPQQASLAREQLMAVSKLLVKYQDDLEDAVVRHQQQCHRFIDDAALRLDEIIERLRSEQKLDAVERFQRSISEIAEQIRSQRAYALLEGNAYSILAARTRELNTYEWSAPRAVEQLAKWGRYWQEHRTQRQGRIDDDTEAIDVSSKLLEWTQRRFEALRGDILTAWDRQKVNARKRADSDLREVADLDLLHRALEHVTRDGYVEQDSIPADMLFNQFARATERLVGGHQTQHMRSHLANVITRERYGKAVEDLVVRQGIRLEHYQSVGELAFEHLRRSGMDGDIVRRIDETRHNVNAKQAIELIKRRRWNNAVPVSAAPMLERNLAVLDATRDARLEAMEESRQWIASLLPTLPELAREAAKEAEDLREQLMPEPEEKAEDATKASPEELQASLEEVRERVEQTSERLRSLADNADYADERQQQQAQDADIALNALAQQMDAAATNTRSAMQEAALSDKESTPQPDDNPPSKREQAAQALDELANTLQRTAEHFETDADDPARQASRQALYEAAGPDAVNQAQSQQAESAATTAQAATSSPEELLEKLENRLDQDEPMQNELSQLAKKAVQDAEESVRQAAEAEESLRRSLERSDPVFAEQKRSLRDRLQAIANRAEAVESQLADTVRQASNRLPKNLRETDVQQGLRQGSPSLKEALEKTRAANSDNTLLSQMEEASQTLQAAIAETAQQQREAAQDVAGSVYDETHPDARSRDRLANDLKNSTRRNLNDWVQALGRESQNWKRKQDEIGRRIRNAQNQERSAREQLQSAEQQQAKNPDADWAAEQVQRAMDNMDQANRGVDAARASLETAKQEADAAARRLNEAKRERPPNLDAGNPAAEAVSEAGQAAAKQLEQLAKEVQALRDEAGFASDLAPAPTASRALAQQQAMTRAAIESATEDLDRASRHQERLGENPAARALSMAAESLRMTTEGPMKAAEAALQTSSGEAPPTTQAEPSQTAEDRSAPNPAAQAGQQLGVAAQQLMNHAGTLADIAQGLDEKMAASTTPPSDSAADSAATGQQQSQRLARTMDELDRALNDSMQSQSADQPGGQASNRGDSNTEPGEPNPGSQDAPSSGAGEQTAGEASQTLADAAADAIRQLSQSRQQQMDQIANAGQPNASENPNAQDSPQQSTAGEATPGNAANGGMPEGGFVDAAGVVRIDDNWGQLRQRGTDDVIQADRNEVPVMYQSAVRAYFEAIAAQAAQDQPRRTQDAAGVNP
ncbi:MAG: hypothetical protein AAGD07_03505 [Planctomycetota bacterium]